MTQNTDLDVMEVTEVQLEELSKEDLINIVRQKQKDEQMFVEQQQRDNKTIQNLQEHANNITKEADKNIEQFAERVKDYSDAVSAQMRGVVHILQGVQEMLSSDFIKEEEK